MPPRSPGGGGFNPGAGGIIGVNDLQRAVDQFDAAVNTLTTTVNNMSSVMSNGMTRSPAMTQNAQGATFTVMPGMGAIPARFTGGYAAATLGQMAAAGGGNGGVPAFRTTVQAAFNSPIGPAMANGIFSPTMPAPLPTGALPQGQYNSPAGPALANGRFYTGGGIIGGGGNGNGGFTFAQTAVQAAGNFTGAVVAAGMSSQSNMLFYNSYGAGIQTQYAIPAQFSQNTAFGRGPNLGNMTFLSPQDAAAANAQLLQLGSGQMGSSQFRQGLYGANAVATGNPGMSAAQAAGFSSQLYSPMTSFRMMTMGLPTPLQYGTGQAGNFASFNNALLSRLGFTPGANGTFNQQQIQALQNPMSFQSLNLQNAGWSQSMIQDYESMLSGANQAAGSTFARQHHIGFTQVEDLMQQASGGKNRSARDRAWSQLQAMGMDRPTLNDLTQLHNQSTANEQAQSGGWNSAMQTSTKYLNDFNQALSHILAGPLGSILGGAKGFGAGAGLARGMLGGGLAGGLLSAIPGVGGVINGIFGGGAGPVSTTQPMTSMGSRPGSSMSGVSGAVATAVADAEQQVGKPYVYGGSSPQTSFDCSGLVMWAYGQAGVKLPRTSQAQWSALRNKSVPLNQVREGDIVFSAGSDGTAQAPGHEALMISNNQIVEAPYTGANIRIRGFNPGEWQHAARPAGGGGSFGTSYSVSGHGSSQGAGNTGAGLGAAGYGSVEEVDAVTAALGGIGGSGRTFNGGSGAQTTTSGSVSGVSTAGGGTPAANRALAKRMAQQMYGWTGSMWTQGLLPLWTQESGFDNLAQNPTSTAFGIAQFLDQTWKPYGPKTKNAGLQIKYGLEYTHDRYGNPIAAEQHERQYNWYGTGGPVIVGDRGPELFEPHQSGTIHNAKDTANLLRGKSGQVAQAPWTASPAALLLLDTLTPANNHARQAGGGVTVTIGNVTVSAPNMTGNQTTSDTQVLGQLVVKQVEDALAKSALINNIARGNTG